MSFEKPDTGASAGPNRLANNFDALRFVAATLVIIHHTSDVHILPTLGSHAPVADFNFGFLGVATFFVVSGYLIMMSWERRPHLLEFMWARALRIFPGLIAAVLVTAFVIGPLLTTLPLGEYVGHPTTFKYLITVDLIHLDQHLPGVTFDYGYPVSVNTPLWTLPVEFKMYVFMAVLGVAGALRKRWLVVAAFVLGVLGGFRPKGAVFAFLSYWGLSAFISGLLGQTNNYPLFFLAGTLLYLFRDRVPVHRVAIGVAFVAWLASHYTHHGLFISLFCWPYLVIAAGTARTPVISQLGRIGDLSYGLYIYAFPIEHVCIRYSGILPNDGALLFFMTFIATLPIAFVSWHLVEKRAMRLKRVFAKKRLRESSNADEQLSTSRKKDLDG
jgi:peptidoglycan/LPS O-acetylase OafA/YrhL